MTEIYQLDRDLRPTARRPVTRREGNGLCRDLGRDARTKPAQTTDEPTTLFVDGRDVPTAVSCDTSHVVARCTVESEYDCLLEPDDRDDWIRHESLFEQMLDQQ
jgi:hypothetical protein